MVLLCMCSHTPWTSRALFTIAIATDFNVSFESLLFVWARLGLPAVREAAPIYKPLHNKLHNTAKRPDAGVEENCRRRAL